MDAPENLPDYVRPEVVALRPARHRSRTLAGGTDAVHAAGTDILPKWPGEEAAFYTQRATLTELFDAYGRTIEAAVGLLFGSDPTMDGVPSSVAGLVDDADGRGTDLTKLGAQVAHAMLLDGLAGILVDYPSVGDPSQLSLRDAQERGLRPYMLPILASQVLSWRTGRIGSQTVLTQLVLEEAAELAAGEYGVAAEPRYRVYRHDLASGAITVAVYAIDVSAGGRKTLREVQAPTPVIGPRVIPFAVAYAAAPRATLVAAPPLDRLAWLNVGHYRVSADHRYLMSICHAPTLTIEKADPEPQPIKIGPNALLRLTGDQSAKWLQAEAGALEASEKTMERQQAQMGALGMAFLARDRSQRAETATGRALDAAADQATLGTAADGVAACLAQALAFAAAFANQPDAPMPTVTIRPDYDASRLDAPTILALSKLAELNQITLATLLTVLKGGNVLPDSLVIEDEVTNTLLQEIERAGRDLPEPVA